MNQDDKEKIYTEERKTLQPVDSKQKLSYKDLQDIWEEDLISTDMLDRRLLTPRISGAALPRPTACACYAMLYNRTKLNTLF